MHRQADRLERFLNVTIAVSFASAITLAIVFFASVAVLATQ